MTSPMLEPFRELSAKVDIPLPQPLVCMINGKIILSAYKPVLEPICDLEWIDGQEASETVTEWLKPEHQSGNRFLPFAKNGAGDYWCVIALASGETGIGLVVHDDDESVISLKTFGDFLFYCLVEGLVDAAPETGGVDLATKVKMNLDPIWTYLYKSQLHALGKITETAPERRPFKSGPKAKPEMLVSLVTQDRQDELFAMVVKGSEVRFGVVPRWDCE